jgi:hypothetical protein
MNPPKVITQLNLPDPPDLTEEDIEKMAQERREIRQEIRIRIERMWNIPADQQQAKSR